MKVWPDSVTPEAIVSLPDLLMRLGIAFGVGCLAAAVRYFTTRHGKRGVDRSFLCTLVLLAPLIALVTVAVGNNFARGFSLVGTLAIVRFRTVMEDISDTAFVIYAVVAGMCIGVGGIDLIIAPLACLPLVLATSWVFQARRAEVPVAEGSLVLRLAFGRPPDERIEALLSQHLTGHRLTGMATARGGSALDATYSIQLPTPDRVFVLVNDLARLESVQGVELKGG